MATLLIAWSAVIPNPVSFSTSIRKLGKAYSFISQPFLELEVIILYTVTNRWTHIWGILEKVLLLWEKDQMWKALLPSALFLCEYGHISLNSSSHLVTMRERPNDQRPWYCRVTEPMPAASSSTSCYVRK